jgi:hypothetical protein
MNKVAIFTHDGNKWEFSGVFSADAAEMELRHLKSLALDVQSFSLDATQEVLSQVLTLEDKLNGNSSISN